MLAVLHVERSPRFPLSPPCYMNECKINSAEICIQAYMDWAQSFDGLTKLIRSFSFYFSHGKKGCHIFSLLCIWKELHRVNKSHRSSSTVLLGPEHERSYITVTYLTFPVLNDKLLQIAFGSGLAFTKILVLQLRTLLHSYITQPLNNTDLHKC